MANNERRVRYLAKNTVLFTISSFGSKLISFFMVPLYTNVLSTAEYGIVDLLATSASLLLFIFSLNISSAVLRFSMDSEANPKTILSFGLEIFGIGFAVLSMGMLLLNFNGILKLNIQNCVYLLLLYFMTGLCEILSNYMRAIDKVKVVVVVSLLCTISTITLNLVSLLWFKLGFNGYMISLIGGQLISVLVYLIVCKFCLFSRDKLSLDDKKKMLAYSVPLIFNGVAWWMNQSLDKYFLLSLMGTDANGLYAAASKIPTILSTFLTVFMQAWNLSAIKEYKKTGSEEFYSITYNVINSFLILSSSFLILLNVPVSRMLLAKDFFEAWRYSSVLIFSGLFSGLSSFVGSFFSAAKKSSIFAISTVIAAIINVVLNIIFIPQYGIQGATVATAVSFIIIWLIRMINVKKFIDLRINIFREVLSYTLLIVQIILEHTDSHAFLLQIVILGMLVVLNFRTFKMIIMEVVKLVRRVLPSERKVE